MRASSSEVVALGCKNWTPSGTASTASPNKHQYRRYPASSPISEPEIEERTIRAGRHIQDREREHRGDRHCVAERVDRLRKAHRHAANRAPDVELKRRQDHS